MDKRLTFLIKACKRQERKAQKELYQIYKMQLFGLVRRYIKDVYIAEDVFAEAMYKVFANIHRFDNRGSFEGWMKRIMVNECLMYLRKTNNKIRHMEIEAQHAVQESVALDRLNAEDIIKLLDSLPEGYRTVFNLYVVEGYKHREIAEMLGISISTSKSQLFLAKKKLQRLIKNKS